MNTVENIYIPIYLSEEIFQKIVKLKEYVKNTHFNIMGIYCPLVCSKNENEFVEKISKIFNITIIDINSLNNCEHIDYKYDVFEDDSYSYYCSKLYEQLKFIKKWCIMNKHSVVEI